MTEQYLLGLAQGLTALLAVTAATLTFVLERTRKKRRVGDSRYTWNLALITVVASATALIAALTWWTWNHVATDVDLLFGASPCLWMAILFGGATVAASLCAIWAVAALIQHLLATRKARKSQA